MAVRGKGSYRGSRGYRGESYKEGRGHIGRGGLRRPI